MEWSALENVYYLNIRVRKIRTSSPEVLG